MLTRYGTDNILIMFLVGALLIGFSFFFNNKVFSYIFSALGFVLILFTIWFFRDPERNIPDEAKNDERIIIAPADGKVVELVEEYEKHYLKDNSTRISIFLSPIDVHVNRSPVSGEVKFYEYMPGDYLVAYHPKSSELNEHSRLGVENQFGKVFFKQIVGVLARRIVCELKVGDKIKSGDKFGMMKFGSRMDVALPLGSEILIKKGQTVVAGETILARLPQK